MVMRSWYSCGPSCPRPRWPDTGGVTALAASALRMTHCTIPALHWQSASCPNARDRRAHAALDRLRDRLRIAAARLAAATRTSRAPRHRRSACIRPCRRRSRPECRSARLPGRPASSPFSVTASATDHDAGEAQPPAVGDGARLRPRSAARRPCRAGRPAPRRRCRPAPGASRTRSPLPHSTTSRHAEPRARARHARRDAAPRHAPGSTICGLPSRTSPPSRRGADGRRHAPDGCGR